ncbi:MAG: hypothetical protein QNJ44_01235 [Rhodobacter sp.]|nr:hypothetical protein [Rhodobacter sp.]
MPTPGLFRTGAMALAILAVASCQTGGVSASRAGFKKNYLVARTALEGGQYAKAARHYAGLLNRAGPLQSRLRLEYAHALLRDGKFDKAAREARRVVGELTGSGRSAALMVQGTADHESARAAISRGRSGLNQINQLKAARAALDEMLKNHPELDPLGAMAVRRKTIDLELGAIQ